MNLTEAIDCKCMLVMTNATLSLKRTIQYNKFAVGSTVQKHTLVLTVVIAEMKCIRINTLKRVIDGFLFQAFSYLRTEMNL